MSEDEYIQLIRHGWPSEGCPSDRLLAMAQEAAELYPLSSELQCLRGDLLRLLPSADDAILQEAIRCYRRALAVDPNSIEALEELGSCYDILEDYCEAEYLFRRAISLGGSPTSFAGLARVLQQKGDTPGALRVLSAAECPFHNDEQVLRRKGEIQRSEWLCGFPRDTGQ